MSQVIGNVDASVAHRGLKAELDRMLRSVDRVALVANDPIELVRAYEDPNDQEVAGLLVAMLAYGRVASIKSKAKQALAALAPSPAQAVEDGRRLRRLNGFVYRFQKNDDVPRFLRAIGRVRKQYGSLGHAFAAMTSSSTDAATYVDAMDRFVSTIAD
ncbi:MAG: DUF2400 family protein, partial [Myxococcota bacterium]